MEEKSLNNINPTRKNPRLVTPDNDEKLDRSLDEYGPMDGIVNNVNPAINELVGGNQRNVRFKRSGAKAVITHRFKEPTEPAGSVAYGYVDFGGERHPYREVFWDITKHNAGILLANQHAGENDNKALATRYEELLEVDPSALDTLFITEAQIEQLHDVLIVEDEIFNKDEKKKEHETRYTKKELLKFSTKFYAPALAEEFVKTLP